MPSPSTCFYIAVGAEALEGAREWGEVWVISYSEEPQILSPPGCSWHQGKASKANLCLDGEVGDGFSVPVFGTHMERPDPPPPRRGKATTEKQLQSQTGITGKESKEYLTGNYRVVGTEGSQEGRRMFLAQTPSHACPQLHVTAEFYEDTEWTYISTLREQLSTQEPSSPVRSNVCNVY